MALMRTYGDREKRSAWRVSGWAFAIGLAFFVALLFIGFPSHLWTPADAVDLSRAFIAVCAIGCGGISVLSGPLTGIEDAEVRAHSGGVIINSWTGIVSMWVGLAPIGCIVLVARYLYLACTAPNLYIASFHYQMVSYAFLMLKAACCGAIILRFRGSPGALWGGIAFGLFVAGDITQVTLSALDIEYWEYTLAFSLVGLAGYGCLLAALITGRTPR